MTYDLETTKGLTQFAKDCKAAIEECPQGEVWNLFCSEYNMPEDRHLRPLSPITTLSYYASDETLWEYGYARYLTPVAYNTFNRYLLDKSGNFFDKVLMKNLTRKALFQIVIGEEEQIIIRSEERKL